jgi:recombination protein RecR
MEFPSKVIEDGVNELSKIAGIVKKTALRLALFILKGSEGDAEGLGNAIIALRKGVKYCKQCGNLTDEEICRICNSHRRNQAMICVVEDCKDVIAIENTGQYTGTYHVLNGIIHPMQGLGPSDLNIESLLNRLRTGACEEVIFALPSSMEGDMTSFYIARKLEEFGVRTSSIARGIPVGSDLEFTDEITLARSLINRTSLTQSTGNGI